MKISYRNHPILERLETGILGQLYTTKEELKMLEEPFIWIENMPRNRMSALQLGWQINSQILGKTLKLGNYIRVEISKE